MKVIKQGSGQEGWAKKYECTGSGNGGGGCGAVLLVEEGDIRITSSRCRDETDYYVTFRCCECKVFTDIDNNDVPSHIYRRLPRCNPHNWDREIDPR